jgi:uncharacterized protein YgfB (UPF0149 family)
MLEQLSEEEKDAIWARIDAMHTYNEWCNDALYGLGIMLNIVLASYLEQLLVH